LSYTDTNRQLKTEVRKLRHNPFFKYLLAQIITIPLVILIFHMIPEKRVASLFASFVFVGLCLGTFFSEYRRARFAARLFWLGGLQFLLIFAIPIFLMRVTHWDQDFSDITFGRLRASDMHVYSNVSFMLWSLICLIEGLRLIKIKRRAQARHL
jgi:hypothetical protein